MEKIDYKFIKAMTNQVKISAISKGRVKKWTTEDKQEHVKRLANISVLH